MNFAVIAPTDNLEQLCANRAVQMCIAPHCEDRKYFMWYKQEARRYGACVILDNGSWENRPMRAKQYIELADILQPRFVTIPDRVNDAFSTRRLWRDFMRHWGSEQQAELIYIPQGSPTETFKQYTEATKTGLNIGIPRAMPNRRRFIQDLKAAGVWRTDLYHHAFGMQSGDLQEILSLAKEGVDSFDSSNPVWRLAETHHDFNPTYSIPPDLMQQAKATIRNIDTALWITPLWNSR